MTNDLRLGCAEEYLVFVTDRTLKNRLVELKWSDITWNRVLDDVSQAVLTVPDSYGGLTCCNDIGGLRTWRNGIRIERDSELVWCGPITYIERSAGVDIDGRGFRITAEDKMAWMKRRVLSAPLDYTAGVDPGTAFRQLIEDGTSIDNAFNLVCPTFTTGYTVFRDYLVANFEYIGDLLQELADVAVDYTVIGDTLYASRDISTLFQGFGLVTAEWFGELPGYQIDGYEQANAVYTPLPDSGEEGFRIWGAASNVPLIAADGLLQFVDTSYGDNLLDQAWADRAALSTVDLRAEPPVVVTGGVFSQNAGIAMSQLIPGVLVRMDIGDDGCLEYLLDVYRLKRVEVDVSVASGELLESVSPDLQPVGSEFL